MPQTQASLLATHRESLNDRWRKKYPSGQFSLQFRGEGNDCGASCEPVRRTGIRHPFMHWQPRRPTSRAIPYGVSVELKNGSTIANHEYKHSSFGKCYNFDSLEKLISACRKQNVPRILTDAFVSRYSNRASEGF